MTIVVKQGGAIRMLYSDRVPLQLLGPVHIERASNVEYSAEHGGWTVQFSNGTYLHRHNEVAHFTKRSDALAAEVAYLEARL